MTLNQDALNRKKRQQRSKIQDAFRVEADYQREVLRYITEIGSLLRLNLDIDTLLRRVTEKACEALHAPKGVLYLINSAATFRLRAVYGLSLVEEMSLQHQVVPDTTIELLTSETYHSGNFSIIPATSSLWQQDIFSPYFHAENETISRDLASSLQQEASWERETLAIFPLRRADARLFGLFILSVEQEQFLVAIEQLHLLQQLITQVEVVIEGARMYEAVRRSNDERAALIEIGRALSSPDALREPQTVYQAIYTQVKSVMPTDALFVSRYYPSPPSMWMEYLIDEEVVYPPFQYNDVPDWIQGILKRETMGLLFSTSEEYNAYTRTLYSVEDDDLIGNPQPSQSWGFVPIHYGDEIIGMLSAQSYQQHAYTQHHMDVLREIAVQAGIALVNARVNRNLREAMKQAQESDRLKNHFLMTASHELRTPLTSIQGYLELLGDYEETLSKEQKHRFISLARRASEELVLLLGNVMDTNRIDQDRVLLRMQSVQVQQAVQLIVEIFEPTIVREERSMQIEVADDLYVQADELRLRQILLNVIGNALKYTPERTAITVHADCLAWSTLLPRIPEYRRESLSQEGNAVVIEVRDQGEGIELEAQKQLFTRFMRLPNALNSVQRGAGLGLYLCRELVEAMHGSIWVESSGVAGEGAAFFIALPAYV